MSACTQNCPCSRTAAKVLGCSGPFDFCTCTKVHLSWGMFRLQNASNLKHWAPKNPTQEVPLIFAVNLSNLTSSHHPSNGFRIERQFWEMEMKPKLLVNQFLDPTFAYFYTYIYIYYIILYYYVYIYIYVCVYIYIYSIYIYICICMYIYIYYTFVEFPKPLVTRLQSTVAWKSPSEPPSVLSGEGALDRRHDHGGGGLEEKHGAGVHHPAGPAW